MPRWHRTIDLRGQASLVVMAVALALSVAGLAGASLHLDGFGLARSLPVTYYTGLVLLVVAGLVEWRAPRPRTLVIMAQVIAFVLVVWLTPLALEHTPRFRTSYVSFGYIDPILRGEGLDPQRFIYHNWPLFPLLFAGLVKVTSVSPPELMEAFPVVVTILYLIPLLALLDLAVPRAPTRWSAPAVSAAGLWLFAVFDWTGQDYFSPQGLTFLFFLAWLVVIARSALYRDGTFGPVEALVMVGLFVLIVATHVLTALLCVMVLIALTLTGMLRRPGLVLACVLVFLLWQAYSAAPFYGVFGHQLVGNALNPGTFIEANLVGRVAGSAQHALVTKVRMFSALAVFGLAAFAAWRLRRKAGWSPPVRFALIALGGVFATAPLSAYGGEMLIRTLLFGLPLVAMLVVAALRDRAVRVATVAAVLVGAPVHILTHFGNEQYDYVSRGELAGFDYVSGLGRAKVYGAFPGAAYRNTSRLDYRNSVKPSGREPVSDHGYLAPASNHWSRSSAPIYVAVGRGDRAAAALFQNRPHFFDELVARLKLDPKYRLVFANRDFLLWRWKPGARR